VFREATSSDLRGLADLERDANLEALGHVFPADRYPFPYDDVLARWRLVLDDPTCVVLVVDDERRAGLVAYLAYDDTTVRHLAVHPRRWGEGLATVALRAALTDLARRGAEEVSLWVLADNRQARDVYEHLGWRATGEQRPAAWPPYPTELHYSRAL
jgi:RimJ/RimL family protein N-acetyltransferase